MLRISETTANRLLRGTGHTVADLRRTAEELGLDELFDLPTEVTVSMDVQGTIQEKVPARHVIGHLPGLAGHVEGAPEADVAKLDDHLVVVLAQYDSPPPGPDGVLYPAANDNASGVAVLLEAIHVLQQTGYQPYKTLMFVAYSTEGLEGGELVLEPDVNRLLRARPALTNLQPEAIVQLQGVGGGTGTRIEVSAGGSQRLAPLPTGQ